MQAPIGCIVSIYQKRGCYLLVAHIVTLYGFNPCCYRRCFPSAVVMSVWFSGAGGGTLAAVQVLTVSKASSSVLILETGVYVVKGALLRLDVLQFLISVNVSVR